jgi:hypothetical protein
MSKRSIVILAAALLCASEAGAQEINNQSTNVISTQPESTADAGAQAIVGGNIFDFSSNGTPRPPAPGLPSFAGGPCTGASFGASTSVAGVAFGSGGSELDESCQRRNWVQTLIGAAQHMPPEEAKILLRLAVETMRDDPYLKGGFERIGIPSVEEAKADPKPAGATSNPNLSSKSSTCRVMVSANAPKASVGYLEARGCEVVVQ